ncbi:plasmid partitioning protein RepB [Pseudaminobacter arsenicus]|uniref:Plasmid partitioning protein RepB n=1 Tax=Borborobacter arsenicus TaxID=1851146 RepID=A0A432V0B2_9HYPH|nr:plasmid partitioning protein RepB [Pseudaminobacter arsenicus]RUM95647.1 plasmid partitioning protein RepB [Pseudaminobacter arsenicus]
MNARKDRLRSLFAGETAEGGGEAATPAPANLGEAPARRSASGAVKAMGLSLGSLSQEVEEARRLREALAAGEQVVELDPALLERSPFLDRLSEGGHNDEAFQELTRSLAEHGQQVPILVRPHPDKDKAARGFYQIAYGHRRVQAARAIGRPVRAVVRELADVDLALAQGKENAERRALSFIERAFFTKTLLDHGFDRATAQAALAVHKSEMSRLLQVTENIPLSIVQAIGPAPKAGRPRWLKLGELLAKDVPGFARDEISRQSFREADSDARFQLVFERLKAAERCRGGGARSGGKRIEDGSGRQIGELSKAGQAMRLTIPASAGQGFADYLVERLPQLHAEFRRTGQGGSAKEN